MKDSKGESFIVGSILRLIDGPQMKCVGIIGDIGRFEWGSVDGNGNWFPSANRYFDVNQKTLNMSKYEVN